MTHLLNKDSILSIATRFIIVLAAFITSIITARYLGVAGRGHYFFIITLAALITQFGNFGLPSSNIFLLSKHPETLGYLLNNSLLLSIVLGGVICLAIYGYVFFIGSEIEYRYLLFIIVLVPAMLFFLLASNLLIGLEEIPIYNISQLTSNLLILLLTVLASLFLPSIGGFLLAITVGWLLGCCYLLIIFAKLCDISFRFNRFVFKLGLGFSFKVYLSTLLGFLILKTNIFILQAYSSDEQLGYFSIISQINDALIVIPSTLGLLIFPKLIKNSHNRWQQTKKYLFTVTFVMLIICVLMWLLITPFIVLTFGQKFLPAVSILTWILPGTFFLGIISIISQYLSALGFPKSQLAIWVIGWFIMMGLSLYLVPRYHAIGAAVALSITYMILFALILLLAIRLKNTQK